VTRSSIREADHLAEQVRVRGLLDQAAQGHLVGHRGSPDQVGVSNPTIAEDPAMTTAPASVRASASIRARPDAGATAELHHHQGHDP
jgi:hypothetical protein